MKAKPNKITIPLRRPYPMLSLAIVMFGGGGAFMIHRAETNDRGLIINGLIELSPPSADVFYAVVGVLCFAFVLIGLVAIVNVARNERFEIVISSKSITFPNARLWRSSQQVRVTFDDIAAIRTSSQTRNPFISFDTRDGTRVLNARWLPDDWSTARVCEVITERWRARSGGE